VQIHGQHPVGAGAGDQIGHQLGRDGRAAAGFTVLTGVAEIGHDGRDSTGGGAHQRIRDNKQLHQIVVGRIAGRLKDEDVLAAHVFFNDGEDLVVGEPLDLGLGQRGVQMVGDSLREAAVGVA
jgi:hypothetical protein